ncbi:MAG: outer-membrane lipoprotein carrier protein LolA [Rhizobiales bacterium]|nr:outer-membrane lipoprotein carrier protein LolA [Hyphomicrobiales bacterium]
MLSLKTGFAGLRRNSAAALVACMAFIAASQSAGAATELTLTPQQNAAVGQVSSFINGFKTLQGEFTQTGPKGTVSRGVFYLQKPGKMRFEYASPNPFVIVSDGTWVTIKNRSKDKADQYPLSQTPLRLVLSDRVNIAKEAKVLSVEDTDASITITLEDRKNIVPGQLILVYDKAINALQQWVVVDGKGRRTTVALQNMVPGVEPDPALFQIAVKRATTQGKKSDR